MDTFCDEIDAADREDEELAPVVDADCEVAATAAEQEKEPALDAAAPLKEGEQELIAGL